MRKNYQAEVIRLAMEEGLNPSNLSPSQFRRLSMKARSPEDLLRDGIAAVTSRALTSAGMRTVSLEQAQKVEKICRNNTCKKFQEVDGDPRCFGCQCSGKFLISKWRDKKGKCPDGLWDNSNA